MTLLYSLQDKNQQQFGEPGYGKISPFNMDIGFIGSSLVGLSYE